MINPTEISTSPKHSIMYWDTIGILRKTGASKPEAYHQYIYDAPVESVPSGFSILNAGADFTFPDKAGLVSKGTGTNTGVELTLEKFFSRGFYLPQYCVHL